METATREQAQPFQDASGASRETIGHAGRSPPLMVSLLRLARPAQWSKSAFVMVGPVYALKDLDLSMGDSFDLLLRAAAAAVAFALASSGCYALNDLFDRQADRAHPRKRSRPIAAGLVSPRAAWVFAAVLFAGGASLLLLLRGSNARWVGLALGLYVVNVLTYSAYLKHKVIADVISLSLGFVLRVMAGCAAAGVEPSVWLLNVTFFLSMFLAFGKRLGERRTLALIPGAVNSGGEDLARAIEHRRVQAGYTDMLLQMAVMVTAVITLMTYALYVNDLGARYTQGFNLMWLTMLPAFYALFRCVLLIERGQYDDPTELAIHDRGFQVAGLAFAGCTMALMWWFSRG